MSREKYKVGSENGLIREEWKKKQKVKRAHPLPHPLPSVLGHALVPFVLVVPDERHPVRDLLPESSHLGPLDRKCLAQEAEPVHPLGLDGDVLRRVVQDLVGGRAGSFLEREGLSDGEVEACKMIIMMKPNERSGLVKDVKTS